MRRLLSVLTVAIVACYAGGVAQDGKKSQPVDAAAGTIEGTVTVKGAVPPPRIIEFRGCTDCISSNGGATSIPSDELVVNGGKVQWVLVSINNAKPKPTHLPPAVLDQQGRFKPHVIGVMMGQELHIRNSDPFWRNPHIKPRINKETNYSQTKKGDLTIHKFNQVKTAPFPVICNIRRWMRAWIAVFDHPFFAVTNKDGQFKIENVPEGEWTLEAWHEKLGTRIARIKTGKQRARVVFVFEATSTINH